MITVVSEIGEDKIVELMDAIADRWADKVGFPIGYSSDVAAAIIKEITGGADERCTFIVRIAPECSPPPDTAPFLVPTARDG